MKYESLCNDILANVGGRENINDAFNCATRLRLVLKDQSKADTDALKKIKGIMGVQFVGEQLQCIIGPQVSAVYAEFCDIAHLEKHAEVDADVDDAKVVKKERGIKGVLNAVIGAMAGCVQPLLPVLIGATMFKLVCTLFGPSMLNLVAEDSDFYRLMYFVGDTVTYFLPIFIGYTGAKYFKVSIPLGIMLGCIYMSPTLMEIVAAGEPFRVYGIPMTLVSYSQSLLPMVLSMWIMSHVERFFKNHIPGSLHLMAVDALTIAVMLPISLCVIGPLGTILGGICAGFFAALPQYIGPFGVAIICFFYNALVITGMHMPIVMAALPAFLATMEDHCIMLAPLMGNFSIMGLALGFWLRAKTKEGKQLGASCFSAIFLGGVTEPSLFGICIPHKKLLLVDLIASGIGGLAAGILGIGIYGMGALNFMYPAALAGHGSFNLIAGTACAVLAAAVAFVGVMILGTDGE